MQTAGSHSGTPFQGFGDAAVDVVIVGAGLSGLTVAHRLRGFGVERVLVLEAAAEVGGRVRPVPRPDGRRLEGGGELVGPHMHAIATLAADVGLSLRSLPGDGQWVRCTDGERLVEDYPLASQPEVAQSVAAATAMLDEMAAQVPVDAPWAAREAASWDATTLQAWFEKHVPDRRAWPSITAEFDYAGASPAEQSLLFAVWTVASMGGWQQWTEGTTHVLDGGTSELVKRLADGGAQICPRSPVRRIDHEADGCTVHTDAGAVRAGAVVVALPPQSAARITFEPALPLPRRRLQERFLQSHGIKLQATYPCPWWRDEGLSGAAVGRQPVSYVFDASHPDSPEGVLTGFVMVTSAIARDHAEQLATPEAVKATFVDELRAYFGPSVPEPVEVHVTDWTTDPWSVGCAVGLPPGVLSTVGPHLRAPVGRIFWAGAETATTNVGWLNGAVEAGERAASEVLAALRPTVTSA